MAKKKKGKRSNKKVQVYVPKPLNELEKKAHGRPKVYNKKIAKEILHRLSCGESLVRICKDDHMPHRFTVHRWVLDNEDGFNDKYARARELQAEYLFDETLEIADDGKNDLMAVGIGDDAHTVVNKEVVNRSRLRVDTRKWYLSKVLPKVYGDKLDITSDNQKIGGNIIEFVNFNKNGNND